MALFLESIGHVGLRVVDRERSLAFYAKLGFTELAWYPPPRVSILKNDAGIELNLIVNGEASDAGPIDGGAEDAGEAVDAGGDGARLIELPASGFRPGRHEISPGWDAGRAARALLNARP